MLTNDTRPSRSNRMRITMQSARRLVQRAPLRQHRHLSSVCIKRRLVNFPVRYQIIQIEITIGTVMVSFVNEMVQVKTIAISGDIKLAIAINTQSSSILQSHANKYIQSRSVSQRTFTMQISHNLFRSTIFDSVTHIYI